MNQPLVQTAAAEHAERFLRDVVEGLTATPKQLPSKYFYDRRGSELFDRICELDEYYLTRTELSIMERYAPDIADVLGEHVLLIEPGSGASLKVRELLKHMHHLAGYVPVDISKEHMASWAASLAEDFPNLSIRPVHADFTEALQVPRHEAARRRVIYFPGSTIGNFALTEASAWLARMAKVAQPGGGLLVGIDLKKDRPTLEAAYNDKQGVTRDFNLNLLARIRDELDADVDIDRFEHKAFYNEAKGRVEMHLVSTEPQTVHLDHTVVKFERGETIHTENSHKYEVGQFQELAANAGWRYVTHWTDERELFNVQYYEAE